MATLLETWRNLAYGDGLDDKKKEELWTNYFTIEKGIYEKILSNPTEVVEGTVKELAEKYGTEVLIMTGFLDGINESLKGYENPIDTMTEDTVVKIEIDPEKLYYNMVEAKAEWLYTLPQWDSISSEEKRKELYKQRSSPLRQEPSSTRSRKLPEPYAARATRSTRTIRVRAEAERSTKSAAAATHKMKRKPLPIAGSGFFITVHGLRLIKEIKCRHIQVLLLSMTLSWIIFHMRNGVNI